MAKSAQLRLAEIRRAFRLIGDCRDVGHDRGAWLGRASEGLTGLIRSKVVICTAVEHTDDPAARQSLEFWDVGWSSPNERAAWLDCMGAGRYLQYETYWRMLRSTDKARVRSRRQLIPDPEWYGAAEFNDDRRPLDQDDTLMAVVPTGLGNGYHYYSINRAVGDPAFDARDVALLRLFTSEARALYGGPLSIARPGPVDRLPPRLRAVLGAIVEGDTEKQIALRLSLSPHTVHDYVKALHRKSGASCRADLLAYYYRFQR